MKTKSIPDGFTTVTPYLIVNGVQEAIKFYKVAFGASEGRCMQIGGKVLHTHIKIGNANLMLADEFKDQGFQSAQTIGGSPAFIHLYVDNVDEVYSSAINAGATEVQPVADQFFGDRHGIVKDPFGYMWAIATHVRDVSDHELDACLLEYSKQM